MISLYPIKIVWEFNGDISKRPKLSLYPISLYPIYTVTKALRSICQHSKNSDEKYIYRLLMDIKM